MKTKAFFLSLVLMLSGCVSVSHETESYRPPVDALAVQPKTLQISKKVFETSQLPFVSHKGAGEFDTALAMNVPYEPVKELRKQLESELGQKLKFFTGWEKEGEAHITVVTPPEYFHLLKDKISIEEIEKIARAHKIQNSSFEVVGLGSATREINGKPETTYFVMVRALNLSEIRKQIFRAFVKAGGNKNKWDPEQFYPHITIGYTERDLHESDGVLKDVAHSLDPKFHLEIGKGF